jgi:hypothetical protein
VTVRELAAADAALVDSLVDQYPFKPYRNYRILSRPKQADVMRAEIDRARQTPGSFALIAGDATDCAVAIARPLAWDSEFFGVAMGRIDYVLRSPGATTECLQHLVSAAIDRFRSADVKHVAVKIDVADVEGVAAVETAGFRLMDALVTYIAHPRRPAVQRVREVGHIRAYEPGDVQQVLAITAEAYKDFQGRFQRDPHLPRSRSAEFYLEWARQCVAGKMADRIYVADDGGGRLIGWASVRRAEPVSTVGGVDVSSGSLGACRPDRPGAYAALIGTAAIDNHADGILTEASTQNFNFAMVRVLEAVGARYARGDYTFHAWIPSTR